VHHTNLCMNIYELRFSSRVRARRLWAVKWWLSSSADSWLSPLLSVSSDALVLNMWMEWSARYGQWQRRRLLCFLLLLMLFWVCWRDELANALFLLFIIHALACTPSFKKKQFILRVCVCVFMCALRQLIFHMH
jgi:hypothetical protein